MKNYLIEATELAELIAQGEVSVIDASWHMPKAKRDAKAEWEAEHIAGAGWFDLDDCADKTSDLPHMLPNAAHFEAAMQALGVRHDSMVVLYDTAGLFSAARLWWMLRVFGHPFDKAKLLNGGLPAWKAAGLPIVSGNKRVEVGNFKAMPQLDMVVGFEDMQHIVAEGSAQILDARSTNRFAGTEPEPRAGVKAGHMDGAINIHYASLLQPDGRLLENDALAARFNEAGVALDAPIVTSCGSGVTAAIIGLALSQLGVEHWRLYDGSWSEWGQYGETTIG